jgi:outer membrane protein OmpA-like peptidoglycan-associated protein/uncharacterized protein YegP (UPF0339 family)
MVNEDYLACSAYEGQSMHGTEGNFASFFDETSQQYFFALLDADGKVLLKSEGYPQPAARENGIQSVIKNRTNSEFYSVKEDDGTYYLSLRAANYREIARSCNVGSESEAMALVAYATGAQVRGGVQATAVAAAKERADDRIDDDYMACKSYAGYGGAGNAIVGFQHEGGQYYFAWYDENGDVLMRSEGYPTTAARDNGMASVEKNRSLEERYAVLEKMGRYFVILKAGNHQEIARSCPFSSEAAARAIFPSGRAAVAAAKIASSEVVETVTEQVEAAAVVTTATAAAASFVAATEPETVVAEVVAEAAPEVVVNTIVAEAAPEVVAAAVVDVEDDYLSCREYHGHETSPRAGFRTFFSEKSNKYYFAVVDADGDVSLRSEGHLTAAERDDDMADVVQNIFKKERYNVKNVGLRHHFIVLRNANGKEIARSCAHENLASVHEAAPFLNPERLAAKVETVEAVAVAPVKLSVSESVKEAPLATVVGTVAASVAGMSIAAAAPVIVETFQSVAVVPPAPPVVETVVEAPAVPADVEDDYLPCREYEGRPISDKANSVAMFKHSNGQFYFAIYNADETVRLRSEGFRTSQDRDKELSGALKNLQNADMYSTVRRGDYYMSILKDKTGREVGRSCLQKDEPTPVIVAAPVVEPVVETPVVAAAAVAAVAAVAAAIPEITIPEMKIPEVTIAPPAFVAPEIVEEVAAETGFKWWWLLLPLLALLAWWMFGKGCGTPAAPKAVTVAPAVEAPAVVETPKAAAPSCDLNWILFDFDKSDITAAAKAELAQMAKILKENKDYVGVLSAHTDGRGSDAYNDELSLRRAAAAKRTLVAMGIEADRLKTQADGKGKPIAENTQDDAGRQFNRRVELYIQDKNGNNICQSIAPNIPDALKAK